MNNIRAASNLTILLGIVLTTAAGLAAYHCSVQIVQRSGLLWPFAFLPGAFIPINIQIIFKFSEVRGLKKYSIDEQRRLRFIINRRVKRMFFSICYHALTASVLVLTSYFTVTSQAPIVPMPGIRLQMLIVAAASMLTLSFFLFFVAVWSLVEIDRFRGLLDEREAANSERRRILSKLDA